MRIAFCALAALLISAPIFDAANAQEANCEVTGISSEQAPPPLPEYDQPPVPGPGYVWTPGYWANNNDDYYWVPGTWIEPPHPGLLWTPPYWAFLGGAYVFHRGYWGQHVGFYGGVDYGYGYTGNGFEGGRWQNNVFYYNRAVTNVRDTRITNVYDRTVVVNRNNVRVSYVGGAGGLIARPTSQQEAWAREAHVPATAAQREHRRAASTDTAAFVSSNHGRPAIAATARPGEMRGPGAVPAREGGPARQMGVPERAPEAGKLPEERKPENGPGAVPRNAPVAPANNRMTPGEERQLHNPAPGAVPTREGGPAQQMGTPRHGPEAGKLQQERRLRNEPGAVPANGNPHMTPGNERMAPGAERPLHNRAPVETRGGPSVPANGNMRMAPGAERPIHNRAPGEMRGGPGMPANGNMRMPRNQEMRPRNEMPGRPAYERPQGNMGRPAEPRGNMMMRGEPHGGGMPGEPRGGGMRGEPHGGMPGGRPEHPGERRQNRPD